MNLVDQLLDVKLDAQEEKEGDEKKEGSPLVDEKYWNCDIC